MLPSWSVWPCCPVRRFSSSSFCSFCQNTPVQFPQGSLQGRPGQGGILRRFSFENQSPAAVFLVASPGLDFPALFPSSSEFQTGNIYLFTGWSALLTQSGVSSANWWRVCNRRHSTTATMAVADAYMPKAPQQQHRRAQYAFLQSLIHLMINPHQYKRC